MEVNPQLWFLRKHKATFIHLRLEGNNRTGRQSDDTGTGAGREWHSQHRMSLMVAPPSSLQRPMLAYAVATAADQVYPHGASLHCSLIPWLLPECREPLPAAWETTVPALCQEITQAPSLESTSNNTRTKASHPSARGNPGLPFLRIPG